MHWSAPEMMIVAGARQLVGGRVCFVGIGFPNVAANLAKRIHNPGLELVYESGVFGAIPARAPLSIGDPVLVTRATAITSMFELFAYYLQGGRIDVGFLGAAQIDRLGNINTTVIGHYDRPKVRLPGSGGACDIAVNARQILVIMKQSRRSFVELVDFCTSPGPARMSATIRAQVQAKGRHMVVVTDLGAYRLDSETDELVLASLNPGVSLDDVRAQAGWPIRVAGNLNVTAPPTTEELRVLREELDLQRVYAR